MSSQVRRDKDWLEKDQNSRARGHVERRKRERESGEREIQTKGCVWPGTVRRGGTTVNSMHLKCFIRNRLINIDPSTPPFF